MTSTAIERLNQIVSNIQSERDLRIEELEARSFKDWGVAPNYNEDYRKIRWYSNKFIPPNLEDSLNLTSTVQSGPLNGYSKPAWKHQMHYELERKNQGLWNRPRIRSINYVKKDTKLALERDLQNCMVENIPFKTRSVEYNPRDQWVYVYGNRAIQYDIYSSRIIAFTYSGVYNKVTSLFFRMFGLNIKLHARKLIWKYKKESLQSISGIPDTVVHLDLNTIYSLYDVVPEGNVSFVMRASPLYLNSTRNIRTQRF